MDFRNYPFIAMDCNSFRQSSHGSTRNIGHQTNLLRRARFQRSARVQGEES